MPTTLDLLMLKGSMISTPGLGGTSKSLPYPGLGFGLHSNMRLRPISDYV